LYDRIPDPFIGFNELKAEWVGEKDWIYRRVVEKPPVPTGSRVFLGFDGLDTFATVTLDNKIILESDNMFLSHRIDVTQALALTTAAAEGAGHVLEIRFDSALLRAQEIQKNYPYHKWIASNGEAARLGVRKAQYHWGWDWGPVLMTAGIWRDVRLEVYHTKIADLWADVQLASDHQVAHVTATATIETSNNDVTAYRTIFSLCLDGVEIARESTAVNPDGKSQTVFKVIKPKLWWPHGYGEQTRYQLAVAVTQDDCAQDVELHHIAKNIGIRTAEVIQQPDKHGKSFFFRINNVDIFCGGSCWIPADSSLPAVTAEKYRKWIQLMIAGHQVMIRCEIYLFNHTHSCFLFIYYSLVYVLYT
jgi:beta-mannosidase